ncbi:uncharacterized protein EDB91DRAFT_1256908 [Suillus paluster]|uniref:uncharacterized protein n=1 Tax=Suillus paluster TaxID=48578 RepID=UPI001B8788F1|nr:uncharacterized protein EDB91DRAFT_1256908 [Suillus paluster]KAG1720607.1 hypothetical protein EDB91DRAFT_1256908 [Suillus paluster]
MDSHEHPIDKAQRLQDERIKADRNFFVMWDQWVPPKLWPTPSPQKDVIPKNLSSVMQTRPDRADALSKKYFGHEIFDMCWSNEADNPPTVETPTATSSASEHFGGQTFDMCWDTEVDPVLIVSEDAVRPAAAGQYNLCWDDEPDPSKVDLPPIVELATIETPTMDVAIPSVAGQYDMCWEGRPSASAVGYEANFDMCWGDSPSGRGDDLCTGGTTAPAINSVNSAANTQQSPESHSTGTQALYDMDFGRGLPDTSVVPRDGLPSEMFETTEDLLCRVTLRLESIDALTRDDLGHTSAINGVASPRDITHANQDLISAYRDARDRLIEASEDVVRMQHLMNMQRQIDDLLHVLLLAMRKMGRGHSCHIPDPSTPSTTYKHPYCWSDPLFPHPLHSSSPTMHEVHLSRISPATSARPRSAFLTLPLCPPTPYPFHPTLSGVPLLCPIGPPDPTPTPSAFPTHGGPSVPLVLPPPDC